MERKHLMRMIDEALDKAGICSLRASDDPCEQCDLYLAADDRLYLYDLATPFTAEDVAAVLHHSEDEENCLDYAFVRIVFENDDYWQFAENSLIIRAGWNYYIDPEEVYEPVDKPLASLAVGWRAVNDRLRRCLHKCGIHNVTVQQEANEVQDLYFDRGIFCIGEEYMTPYTENDFQEITFMRGERLNEPSHVLVRFRNGDTLHITAAGMYGEVTVAPGKRVNRSDLGYKELCHAIVRAQRTEVSLTEEFVVVDGVLALYNGNDKLVRIPEGVERIGSQVFRDMPICEVWMPDSLREIGAEAFRWCSSLKHAALNEGLEWIRYEAFVGCGSLRHIDLPDSMKRIDCFAFGHSGVRAFDHVPEDCDVAEDVFELALPY